MSYYDDCDEREPRYTREQYNQYKSKCTEIDFSKTKENYPTKCVMCKDSFKYQNAHVAGCQHAYCADCFTHLEDYSERHVNGGPPLGYSCKDCKKTIKSVTTFRASKSTLPRSLTSQGIVWNPVTGYGDITPAAAAAAAPVSVSVTAATAESK